MQRASFHKDQISIFIIKVQAFVVTEHVLNQILITHFCPEINCEVNNTLWISGVMDYGQG